MEHRNRVFLSLFGNTLSNNGNGNVGMKTVLFYFLHDDKNSKAGIENQGRSGLRKHTHNHNKPTTCTCTHAAFENLKDSRYSLVLSRDECSNLTDNALTKKRRPWRFTPRLMPLVQRVTYKRYTSMQRRLIRACTNVQSHQSLSRQGGGGGTLIFSAYVGSDPVSTVHPPKNIRNLKHPKKYLKL